MFTSRSLVWAKFGLLFFLLGFLGVAVSTHLPTTGAAAPSAPLASAYFSNPVTYTTGGQAPSHAAVGDFNGDGKLDLAVSNNSSGTIGILKGNGDGTFQPAVTFPTGSLPFGNWTADLNGDGKLDLIIARRTNNVIDVMLGNGDDTFQPYITYGTGPGVSSVTVADFNNDGKLDIATANNGSNTVSVLFGNGDGTFQSATNWSTGSSNPGNLTVGDFNHDNSLDIAVSTIDSVVVLLNNGTGGFSTHNNYLTGQYPNAVSTADLNNDGKLDLIAGYTQIYHGFIFLGNGDGTFQPQNTPAGDTTVHPIVLGDFNGDGQIDYAWIDTTNKQLQVYGGKGDGTFQLIFSCNLSVSPYNLAMGDFNGDGKPDIVTTNETNNNITVFLNTNPSLSISDTSVVEGNSGTTSVVFTTTLSSSCCVTTTVNYATADGTATVADNDYVPITGTLTFAPGETSKTITVTVNGDTKVEPNETFKVNLNNSVNAVISKSVGIGTIINDDTYVPTFAATYYPSGGTGNTSPARAVNVLGDFNGDGKLDIAVTNEATNNFGILLNNGDGTFQSPLTFTTSDHPNGIQTADLNGDGKLDIVIGHGYSSSVDVYLGSGNGQFSLAHTYTPSYATDYPILADLNGDGKLDIAVGTQNGNLYVLRGNGDGSFQTPLASPLGTTPGTNQPVQLAAGDFNGDGKQDIAAVAQPFGVGVVLGNGDGSFQSPTFYSNVASYPSSIATLDLNGDGKLDLVVALDAPSSYYVMLGRGDGTFNSPGINTPYTSSGHTSSLGDFNGDGKADLLWKSAGATTTIFKIFANNGDGTFSEIFSCTVNYQAYFSTVGDLNGDGKLDVVLSNSKTNNVTVLLSSQTSSLSISDSSVVEGNSGTTSAVFTATLSGSCCQTITATYATADGTATVADNDYVPITGTITFAPGETSKTITVTVNGDTKVEPNETFTVNLGNLSSGVISKSIGTGTIINDDFPPPPPVNFAGPVNYATGGNFPQVVAKGDFNGDGKLDLAVGNTNSGTIGLLLGNGDGTFQAARTVNAGNGVFGVTAADLDGDGKLDLIATSFNNNQMNILYGNGDGTFQTPVSYPANTAAIATVGDFNGDGKLDIACPNYSSNQIAIFLNNGGRSFQTPIFATSGTGSGPNYLVAQDFNGDGKLDLAATNTNGGINTPNSTVSILLGKGDGTFQPAVEYRAGANPASLVAADFNGDGKLDLVTGISNPNKVFVLLGNGDGTFNPIGIYTPSSVAGHPIAVADFNGDGKADVVWVDYTNTTISILAGNGNGTFQLLYSCTLSVSPSFALAADLNGDGKPDFVTVNQNNNNLSVFINSNIPSLSISDSSVVEGNSGTTSAVFTATLSGSCCQTITATYATADGTATVADNDYVPISSTLTFGPGETSKTITVTVNGDTKVEPNETFKVNLSNSSSAVISKSTGIGTIINDDTYVPTFAATYYPTGGTSSSGLGLSCNVVGDFNGDGKLDIAVTNQSSNNFGILLNNGAGTFQTPIVVATAANPNGISTADLNGDGNLDLVLGFASSNHVDVYLGSGNGQFTLAHSYTVNFSADYPLIVDIDKDGKLDIVVGTQTGGGQGTVTVLRGNGDGTFQTPVNSTVGTSKPTDVTFGDFNKDGKLDIAAANQPTGVSILLGNGDGTFQTPTVYSNVGQYPSRIKTLDLNGDGNLDLVMALDAPSYYYVMLGHGDGTFTSTGVNTAYTSSGHDISLGDFNGDGKLDLLWQSAGANTTTFKIFANNGDGTFTEIFNCTVNYQAFFSAVGDFNGDGKLDGVFSNFKVNKVTVLLSGQTPSLSISDSSVVEGNSGTTSAVFTATLSGSCCQTITATYATADGTATVADNDYLPISGTLTFAPGETSKTITVTVNGDTKYEPDETFKVNLSNPVGATILTGTATGTIINDDGQPALSINDLRQNEGNSGPTPFGFNVTLSNVSSLPVTVNFATTDGTATVADNDYVPISGTLTFAPGEISKPLTVTVNGDTKFEPDETFTVTLSISVNATISKSVGIGTIVNDDAVPCDPSVVTHSEDDGQASTCGTLSYALANANTQMTITFNLSGTNTVTMTGPLTPTVKSEVVIKGGNSCGAPIIINGNGVSGDGLRLSGHDTLINLWIKGFGGRQLVVNPPVGGRNVLSCVKASKS